MPNSNIAGETKKKTKRDSLLYQTHTHEKPRLYVCVCVQPSITASINFHFGGCLFPFVFRCSQYTGKCAYLHQSKWAEVNCGGKRSVNVIMTGLDANLSFFNWIVTRFPSKTSISVEVRQMAESSPVNKSLIKNGKKLHGKAKRPDTATTTNRGGCYGKDYSRGSLSIRGCSSQTFSYLFKRGQMVQ